MKLRPLALEFIGYAAASAVALAADIGLLTALSRVLGWHYLPASAVSFIAGGVIAYFLSVRLAFRFHNLANRSVELMSFIALGVAGLLVNSVVMWLAVAWLGSTIIAAKLCAAICTFTVNFLLRRQLLFTAPATSHITLRVTE